MADLRFLWLRRVGPPSGGGPRAHSWADLASCFRFFLLDRSAVLGRGLASNGRAVGRQRLCERATGGRWAASNGLATSNEQRGSGGERASGQLESCKKSQPNVGRISKNAHASDESEGDMK